MKALFRLFIIGFLLTLLCFTVGSTPAHAQTTAAATIAQPQARATVTYLERSARGYGDYFSPTYVSCRVFVPCVTIVNGTGRAVLLSGVARGFVWLAPGQRYSVVFYQGGMHYVGTVRGFVRVPLTVSVSGGWQWWWRW